MIDNFIIRWNMRKTSIRILKTMKISIERWLMCSVFNFFSQKYENNVKCSISFYIQHVCVHVHCTVHNNHNVRLQRRMSNSDIKLCENKWECFMLNIKKHKQTHISAPNIHTEAKWLPCNVFHIGSILGVKGKYLSSGYID